MLNFNVSLSGTMKQSLHSFDSRIDALSSFFSDQSSMHRHMEVVDKYEEHVIDDRARVLAAKVRRS